MTPTADLARGVREGDRRALARAITLVESTRSDHREEAVALLEAILPATGTATRVGISGAPGAGKSTFIETLGVHLVDAGHRVAVLAVDPSSARSGGSILGDKTRMEQLSRRPEAFIRPSPSGGTLGGVARRTREALLVCEASGFDVVLVETVGVGQSEVAVAGMVDLFVLLLAPGAGDELQGVKRGIVELADLLVVNKADGELADAALNTAADYAHALHLVRASDDRAMERVRTCSAILGDGIDELWALVGELVDGARASGELEAKRREQARSWMWSEVTDTLLDELRDDPAVKRRIESLEADVMKGHLAPAAAAREVLAAVPVPMMRGLQRLAVAMLQQYDIDVADVSFVTTAFNTVFRVDAKDGSSYAFRVSPSLRIHDDLCEMAEAEWVTALRRDAEFPTPAVILTSAGFPVVLAASLRLGSRTGVLFDWVGGRPLREEMTAAGARATGRLAARAHEHAVSYATEAPDGVLVADRVLYFRLPDRLEELRPAYGSAIADGRARAQLAIDEMWQSPPHAPHLLHGDLQPGNVLVDQENVSLIDFQDLIWGFEIQDAVIAHHTLKGQFPGRKELWDAFRSGYAEIRPWPEAEPEAKAALLAARHLNVLNLGLSVRKPGLDEFVARHAGAVVDWIRD